MSSENTAMNPITTEKKISDSRIELLTTDKKMSDAKILPGSRTPSNAKIIASREGSNVVIAKRAISTTDVIRKASDTRLLE